MAGAKRGRSCQCSGSSRWLSNLRHAAVPSPLATYHAFRCVEPVSDTGAVALQLLMVLDITGDEV
jgi:hypothetical protein